jgi:hypothetical protein
VLKVMGALVAPGGMDPVSKLLPVAVWVMESALRHEILWPTLTAPGLGVNDCAPLIELIVIVMSAAVPVVAAGVDAADGLVDP